MRPGFAVDIDNVVAQAEQEVQRIFHELTGKSWPSETYASAGGLDTSNLDPDLIERIFDYFHERSIPVLPLVPGARRVLRQLQKGYRIVLITARRPTARPQTLAWLEEHGIPFDELHHAKDKTDVAEGIVVAVDDHPEHVSDYLDQGVRVFLMDQPWNRTFAAPGATRVSGWDELWQTLGMSPNSAS